MTCYDCAYLGFDRNEVVGMAEMCNHPGKWIPGAGFADSEHECEFFKKKSGVSKWDSYSEDEKEKAREYFQEYYVQNPVGDLTCEQAWAQFVEYLKTTDSNAYNIDFHADCVGNGINTVCVFDRYKTDKNGVTIYNGENKEFEAEHCTARI